MRNYTKTQLWNRISQRTEFTVVLGQVRKVAEALGKQVEKLLPAYTDHSILHMDALWAVTEVVLTPEQIEAMDEGEAFALGVSFYAHDLGMAFASTPEGLDEIRATEAYKTEYRRLIRANSSKLEMSDLLSVRSALRDLHAANGSKMVTDELPGLKRFLLSDTEIREAWGATIGMIAESHHWPVSEIERQLGVRGVTACPDGIGSFDAAYVACLLRIIDFAHINRERAPRLELQLRPKMELESLLHWKAQGNINGPDRDYDQLKFTSINALDDIDAWWLFFDMAKGLDAEIRSVGGYLRSRTVSSGRYTLFGVRGIESPEAFSHLVALSGSIQPLDIQVQPHSMDRVVDLLGGKALYGSDSLAPIRELIQNSRDAIELRRAKNRELGLPAVQGSISIKIEQHQSKASLSVTDDGFGMSRNTVMKYLLSVASSFWNSSDFSREFGQVHAHGFEPIGKFGVGFLSVFMLGDIVEVETESAANKRLILRLRGIKRRGELREVAANGQLGTSITISLHPEIIERLQHFTDIVKARAPMLTSTINLRAHSLKDGSSTIQPLWWQKIARDELDTFVENWQQMAYFGKFGRGDRDYLYRYHRPGSEFSLNVWPGEKPELLTDWCRIVCANRGSGKGVILCSKGIAVAHVRNPKLTGIMECGKMELTVSRHSSLDFDLTGRVSNAAELPKRWTDEMLPLMTTRILEKLDEMETHGMLPARLEFVKYICESFDEEIILKTTLPWIPVVEPPGNLIHYCLENFVQKLGKLDKVMLGIGLSAATAYALSTNNIGEVDAGSALMVPIPIDEFDIGYDLERKLEEEFGTELKGSYGELLDRANVERSDLLLLNTLISAIGKSWNITEASLMNENWHLIPKKNILWVFIKRENHPIAR